MFGLYFQAQPHWLADPDAQDYAQLGRQIAAGRGPVTRYMPWNGLVYLGQRDPASPAAEPWPNIARFPLTPALMAFGFAALGPSDESVHLPGGLAFILTAACAGWLGARVYGPWAGLGAGLTAAFLPMLVNYSLTGLTEPLLGLLIVAMLACVTSGRLMLGGLMLGLAILNRYDSALLALPILGLWLLWPPDSGGSRLGRWRATLRFLAPAAVLVVPWALYLLVVAGAPLFNLQPASIAAQASGRSDGLGWYLPEYVTPGEYLSANPSRALRTAWQEIAETPNYLRKLLGWPWLLTGASACVLGLVRGRLRNDGARLVIFLLIAVLLRAALASTLGLNLQRHFVPLVPLLLVIVAGEADWLARTALRLVTVRAESVGGRAAASIAIATVAAGRAGIILWLAVPGLLTIGPFLVPPREPPGPPTRAGEIEARPENLARLAEVVGPGKIVASNVPWSVAWQADRRAVPLPPTVEDTPALERRLGISIDAIYVAGQVAIADAPRSWRAWDDLRRRGVPPPGYMLAESFQNGGRLFVKSP